MGPFNILIFTLSVNLAWSLPLALQENSGENENNVSQNQNVQNISAEDFLKKIESPTDTEFQKEAKTLVEKYLVSQSISSGFSNKKSSKAEKNYFTPSEEDIIRQRIMAALTAAKNDEGENTTPLATTEPSKLDVTPESVSLHSNDTDGQTPTTEPVPESNSTEPIIPVYKYPPTVRDMIEDFISNIRKRNVSGVVEIGLKLATFETIGQGLRETVNNALLHALHRYLLLNFRLRTITQRLRNPQISFLDAFRIPKSPLSHEISPPSRLRMR